jgi:hypothetical protein
LTQEVQEEDSGPEHVAHVMSQAVHAGVEPLRSPYVPVGQDETQATPER